MDKGKEDGIMPEEADRPPGSAVAEVMGPSMFEEGSGCRQACYAPAMWTAIGFERT